MDIYNFIDWFEYDIKKLYIDRFWLSINDKNWIIIDYSMLKWIGYSCARDRDNKRKYLLLLQEHFNIETDYKIVDKGHIINGDHVVAQNNCIIIDSNRKSWSYQRLLSLA